VTEDGAAKAAINYLGIVTVVLLVAILLLGFVGFNSLKERVDSNEMIISESLRSSVPAPYDSDHIPCKKCRGAINDAASHTAHLERAEIIYMLKRNRTGHSAFDLGVNKCIDLVEQRNQD